MIFVLNVSKSKEKTKLSPAYVHTNLCPTNRQGQHRSHDTEFALIVSSTSLMASLLIILKIPIYYSPKVKIAKVGYSSMVECLICKALSSIPNTRKTTKPLTHHHQKREGIQKKKKKGIQEIQ